MKQHSNPTRPAWGGLILLALCCLTGIAHGDTPPDQWRNEITASGAQEFNPQASESGTILIVLGINIALLAVTAYLLLRLRRSNRKLESLAETQRIGQMGSWELVLASGVLTWSDEIYRIFEIDPLRFSATYDAFMNAIHPDDREAVNKAYRESLENRTSYFIEHRLLFADGRIKYVRECCETFYRADGKPVRSVGTVQDISERKRLETELRLQANFQQSLLNAMNEVGMQLMVIENGQITYVSNRKLASEFGYSDGELESGTPLLDIIHPDDRARVMDYHIRRVAGDESVPNSYELGLLTRSGERREYETSVVVVPGSKPVRVIIVGKDITRRKQAQRELELLNRAVNQSSDAMFVQDVSHRFISVNDAACRSLGYSREELMEMTASDIDPDFTQEMLVHAFATAELGKPSSFETRHRAKDGRIFPVEITGTFFELDGIRHVISMARDITERKNAEHTQNKLARALKLLSECGMLLAHAKNEQELLGDACRLAVEIGGYRMAWIGFAEKDEHKTVRPVAQSGFEDGYLDGINVTWADTERGQGPIGIAIRTGVASINHDFQTNQGLTIWREAAIRRGFRTSIAIPLVSDGQMLGSLNIYSAEVQAFRNNEEVALLQELADNIALGIGMLRTSALQARMEAELAAREQEFRSLAESSPDIIVRFDCGCRYVYVNPVFEKKSGFRLDELRGKMPTQVPGLPEAGLFHQHVLEVIETSLAVEFEHSTKDREGNTGWRLVNIFPELDTGGRVAHVQVLSRNITTLKETERHLEESRSRLRQLLAHQENNREDERKKLAGDMHEDLLQILSVMQMNGKLLQSNSGGMPAHITKTLPSLISGLGQSINLVRNMVVSLRPTVLNLGIEPALEWLADEFTKRRPGKACKLTCSDAEQMEEKSSLLVFRIAQEALEAAGNIAGANNVSIALQREEGCYLLTIRNDATEDSLDMTAGNFLNLSGLQERVIAMGGEMDMFSAPDHGLIIEAQIPVQDAG